MGKSPGQSASAIESLLSERSQFEQWLSKLAASNAPESVREKVRSDYEQRLAKVMESLREHADAIDAELKRHESSRVDLEKRESAALETMSEAELRHSVGEFDSGKWDEISRSQKAALDGIRSELKRVRGEISRLSEVQASISGESREEPEETPEPEPARAPAAARAGTAAAADATRTASRSDRPKDELDFLKSVAVEQSSSLSPSAAAGQKLPPEPPAPIPPPAAEPPPASEAPAQAKLSSPSGQTKTLKCGECGTLNRPTEWYCERCGAELAAL